MDLGVVQRADACVVGPRNRTDLRVEPPPAPMDRAWDTDSPRGAALSVSFAAGTCSPDAPSCAWLCGH